MTGPMRRDRVTVAPCRCRELHPASSHDESVLVNESAQNVGSSQHGWIECTDRSRLACRGLWRPLVERSVRAMAVVVAEVLGEDGFKVAATKDEEPIETLAPDRTHEALCDGVRSRRPDRSPDGPDAFGSEDRVERGRELGIAVSD